MTEYGKVVYKLTSARNLTDAEEAELHDALDFNFNFSLAFGSYDELVDFCWGKYGQLWEERVGPTAHPVDCPSGCTWWNDTVLCPTPDEHKVDYTHFIHQRGWYVNTEPPNVGDQGGASWTMTRPGRESN